MKASRKGNPRTFGVKEFQQEAIHTKKICILASWDLEPWVLWCREEEFQNASDLCRSQGYESYLQRTPRWLF